MASLNKVMVIGHLGKDPVMRAMPDGKAVASFSVAASESYTDKSGAKVEKTEWFNVVCFARLAEICGQYLKKGSLVYVEGKLQTRKYEKEGQERQITEVVASEMKMLGGTGDRAATKAPAPAPKPAAARSGGSGSGFEGMDDDIPF